MEEVGEKEEEEEEVLKGVEVQFWGGDGELLRTIVMKRVNLEQVCVCVCVVRT